MICVHYMADKLTADEAFRNMGEMASSGAIDDVHQAEIVGMILKYEMDEVCEELDFSLDELFI